MDVDEHPNIACYCGGYLCEGVKTWVADPYLLEIEEEVSMGYMCEQEHQDRADDI